MHACVNQGGGGQKPRSLVSSQGRLAVLSLLPLLLAACCLLSPTRKRAPAGIPTQNGFAGTSYTASQRLGPRRPRPRRAKLSRPTLPRPAPYPSSVRDCESSLSLFTAHAREGVSKPSHVSNRSPSSLLFCIFNLVYRVHTPYFFFLLDGLLHAITMGR